MPSLTEEEHAAPDAVRVASQPSKVLRSYALDGIGLAKKLAPSMLQVGVWCSEFRQGREPLSVRSRNSTGFVFCWMSSSHLLRAVFALPAPSQLNLLFVSLRPVFTGAPLRGIPEHNLSRHGGWRHAR